MFSSCITAFLLYSAVMAEDAFTKLFEALVLIVLVGCIETGTPLLPWGRYPETIDKTIHTEGSQAA